jgi:hypothetical protein
LAAFLTHLSKDPRPGVIIRIQTMMLMKATYAMTYKSAYGYTKGCKSFFDNISYTVAADDVNKYSYDVRKLLG